MAGVDLPEVPLWNSDQPTPPRVGHCFFKGQSVQLLWSIVQKRVWSTYTQEEKEKQVMCLASRWFQICLMRTVLTWPSLEPQFTFLCAPHLWGFLHTSWRKGFCLGITIVPVCLACCSSHLHTSSVCFCKLQRRTNHGLEKEGKTREEVWGGDKYILVVMFCSGCLYHAQALGPGYYPHTQNSWWPQAF